MASQGKSIPPPAQGDEVEGYWPDDDTWLLASISAINDDGTYKIIWTADQSESNVPNDYVRRIAGEEETTEKRNDLSTIAGQVTARTRLDKQSSLPALNDGIDRNAEAPSTVVIAGAKGKHVNGHYFLQPSAHNGKPCWSRQDIADRWLVWWGSGWKVTNLASKNSGTTTSWLWSKEDASLPTLVTAWKSVQGGKWVSQPVTVEKLETVEKVDEPGCYVDVEGIGLACSNVERDAIATEARDATAEDDAAKGRFAFISILFGQKVGYCIDALVLGEALRAHGTQYPYILLITEDVPPEWQTVLSKVGWEVRLVDYINGDHLYIGGRFEGVFTKLHALNLVEFEKICLLDLDLLVRANIDELFRRETPSAMRRHASADFVDEELIPSEKLVNRLGFLISGINAGVMVMKPSRDHFNQMLEQIRAENPPEHLKSGMPEQDFLTRFYKDSWHHLSVRYNYQPHQIAFTDRRGLEKCERLTLDYLDVSIVHFSASLKPRDLLIHSDYQEMSEMKYAEEILLTQYLRGVQSDHRKGGYSSLNSHALEAQLRLATRASTGEWFSHWHQLVEKFPELEFLIDTDLIDTEKKKKRSGGGHFNPRRRSRSRHFQYKRRWRRS